MGLVCNMILNGGIKIESKIYRNIVGQTEVNIINIIGMIMRTRKLTFLTLICKIKKLDHKLLTL